MLVSELDSFKERVFVAMRSCLMAFIPLLAHLLFIPMLIFFISNFEDQFDFKRSKERHQMFLKVNVDCIKDHFQ